ncbi:MAG: DNA-binding protein WhiA [Defluviitaleaceae bacterium]|nr:DNA-binding protein WhiA [Defluviitaleaceae bacterium]
MISSFTKAVRSELSENNKKMDRQRAFVRDCFISSGVVSNPSRTYHLEFSLGEEGADKLVKILSGFGLRPKKFARGGQFVVYLKEAEEIADVLKVVSAHKSLLVFEKMRVEKAIANNVNRKVNFETANLNKTVDAAQSQIEAIGFISRSVGLSYLSESLEEIARLRLENENMSLAEIGELTDPPVGKSGVNHRLRKICKIAEELKRDEGYA